VPVITLPEKLDPEKSDSALTFGWVSERYLVVSNEAVASLGGVEFSRSHWVRT
jgi:hypothetical protein